MVARQVTWTLFDPERVHISIFVAIGICTAVLGGAAFIWTIDGRSKRTADDLAEFKTEMRSELNEIKSQNRELRKSVSDIQVDVSYIRGVFSKIESNLR